MNAPLPPRKDQEIKEESSYSTGYNQSFSTASTQTPPQCQLQSSHVAEQTSLSQESLSSGKNCTCLHFKKSWKSFMKALQIILIYYLCCEYIQVLLTHKFLTTEALM